MIYLYNEYFSFFSRLKKFLGKGARGPEAVFSCLVNGLSELKLDYLVNAALASPIQTACVLGGTNTLNWAIGQKKKGRIKKIAAGPNLVVSPEEENGILKSPEVDKIIVPSPWVKDFYVSVDPLLSSNIAVWAAGVKDRGLLVNPQGSMVIFYKSGSFEPASKAYDLGKKYNLNPSTIFYGGFKHGDYIEILKTAKLLVYISESESQGLALHEAWMAGVPTLVWDRGFFEYKNHRFEQQGISAPYLTKDCGLFFKDGQDLESQLKNLLDNYQKFDPRKYSLDNFTDKICAQKYLEIINA